MGEMPSLDVRAPAANGPSMASSALSPSSEGSLGPAQEKVRLRVNYGGTFVQVRPGIICTARLRRPSSSSGVV